MLFERVIDLLSNSEVAHLLSQKLSKINGQTPQLKIGLIGEFSAGKSSLLNALLGLKILPASSNPTTGCITVVESVEGITEPSIYLRDLEGNEEEVQASTFSQAILRGSDKIPVLKVPSADVIPHGFLFVDTPGVESLNNKHTKLLLNSLSELDCILICVDINRGGLSKSLVDLLQQKDLMIDPKHMIFVLTKSDLKAPTAVKRVIADLHNQLDEILSSDLSNRVYSVSAHHHLQEKDGGVLELIKGISERFYSAQATLIENRRKQQSLWAARDMVFALEQIHANASLDQSGRLDQEAELKKKRENARAERSRQRSKVSEFTSEFRNSLSSQCQRFISGFASPEAKTRETALNELVAEMQRNTSAHINRYIEGMELHQYPLNPGILHEIESLYKTKELISTMVTSAVAAMVTGGTSTAANMAEGAVVQAIQVFGSEKGQGKLSKLLNAVTDGIKSVNPLDIVGDMIAQKMAYEKAEQIISSIVHEHVKNVCQQLENHFESVVFPKIDQQLEELETLLRESRVNMKVERSEFKEQNARRIKLISELKSLLS